MNLAAPALVPKRYSSYLLRCMMPLGQLIEIDREDLMRWIGPVAGLAAALVVFLICMLVIGWRRRTGRALPPVPSPSAGKASAGKGATADDIFTHGSKTERRNAVRRGGNPIAILISDAEARSKPTNGYVIDRSTGGLCLTVPDEVMAGTVLSVRTLNAPESIPWVQVHVKSCRANAGEFELGCQFVRTPPWSVMLLFG